MRHAVVASLVWVAVGLGASSPSAQGDMIAPPPVAQQAAGADCIVMGKITGLEDGAALAVPGAQQKTGYRIATVKINRILFGAKGLTHLRVGFQPVAANVPVFRRYRYGPNLQVGQELCFVLNQHWQRNFYLMPPRYFPIDCKNTKFTSPQLTVVDRIAKILGNPSAGLHSKSADDRLFAAGLMIMRYRSAVRYQGFAVKLEPIDAKQSKRILAVLAEADWSKYQTQLLATPLNLFSQLGLTAKDGWQPPQNAKDYVREYTAAGKAWIEKQGRDYRIQRFVANTKSKSN